MPLGGLAHAPRGARAACAAGSHIARGSRGAPRSDAPLLSGARSGLVV